MGFQTKDSGKRQDFETGARRDTQAGKLRFDLLPKGAVITLCRTYGDFDEFFEDVPIVSDVPDLSDPAESKDAEILATVRMDLIPDYALHRVAALYGRGEQKYGANNWTKGIHLARTFASCARHLFMWAWGDTAEDHLAAVIWNAISLMYTEREIVEGRLPEYLGDMGWLKKRKKNP